MKILTYYYISIPKMLCDAEHFLLFNCEGCGKDALLENLSTGTT